MWIIIIIEYFIFFIVYPLLDELGLGNIYDKIFFPIGSFLSIYIFLEVRFLLQAIFLGVFLF